MNPILHLFGQEIDHEPPNPAEWELEAGFQLGEIAEQIANELKLHDLDDVLTALRKSRAFPALLAAGMLSPHIWKTIAYTWGTRPFSWKKWEVKWVRPARPAIIMVAIASMIGLLMYADDQLDDKLFPTLQELLLGLVRDLPGPTADRAKLNGEVVGNVVGVFMFNSLVFKATNRAPQKKKWKDNNAEEKWAKLTNMPLLGSSIQRNLKIGTVGPILRLRQGSLGHEQALVEPSLGLPGRLALREELIEGAVLAGQRSPVDADEFEAALRVQHTPAARGRHDLLLSPRPQSLARLLSTVVLAFVVALAPPTVEYRQVEGPVHGRLHSAGAGRFHGRKWRVQPHIDARA